MPSISPIVASQTITIAPHPSFAITPNYSATTTLEPSADTAFNFDPTSSSFAPAIVSNAAPVNIGQIVPQPDINIAIGEVPSSNTAGVLNAFQYKFQNFEITDPESYEPGMLVSFNGGSNNYNGNLAAVHTQNIAFAYQGLWIFVSYSESSKDLVLMQKGYIDLQDDQINNWVIGRTIYFNQDKFDTTPTTVSQQWVRSLGYCVPNTENKKRIWFDPDTTYLKLL